jgi:hypothetical protein
MNPHDQDSLRLSIAILLLLLAIIILILAGDTRKAHSATIDRRALLVSVVNYKLSLHEPYVKGKADCSMAMFRILSRIFPEFKAYKWFRRTTADAMAGWPWTPIMRLRDAMLGDLLFAGHSKLDHVMMAWRYHETIVHASSSKGFVEGNLRPYWYPRVSLVIRPPY